jgi:hypothetical protein
MSYAICVFIDMRIRGVDVRWMDQLIIQLQIKMVVQVYSEL